MLSPSFYVVPHNKSGSTAPLAPRTSAGKLRHGTHSYGKSDWFANLFSWIEMVVRIFLLDLVS